MNHVQLVLKIRGEKIILRLNLDQGKLVGKKKVRKINFFPLFVLKKKGKKESVSENK